MGETEAVRAAFSDFLLAMQAGDTDLLTALVEVGFTLTHITGYAQPGREWLAEIRDGQFIYHRISVASVDVDVDGETATLVARTRTDARVYGFRNDWPLRLALDYALRDGRWIARRAVATVWN